MVVTVERHITSQEIVTYNTNRPLVILNAPVTFNGLWGNVASSIVTISQEFIKILNWLISNFIQVNNLKLRIIGIYM